MQLRERGHAFAKTCPRWQRMYSCRAERAQMKLQKMHGAQRRARRNACMHAARACMRTRACTRTKLQKHARGIKHHPCCDALPPLPCACMVAAWSIAQFARTRWLACMQRADALASMHAARSARGWVCVGMHAEACTKSCAPSAPVCTPACLRSSAPMWSLMFKGKGQISVL